MRIRAAKAKVTPKGIKLKKNFYSNIHAIRDLWFEKAQIEGEWEIEVYYDTRSTNAIY